MADELDISRGDILAAPDRPPEVTDQVMAHVIWMNEKPNAAGADLHPEALRPIGARRDHRTEAQAQCREPRATRCEDLELNEIGVCNIALDRPIAYSPYAENQDLGGFLLIDRISNETVRGVGLIDFGLRRANQPVVAGL